MLALGEEGPAQDGLAEEEEPHPREAVTAVVCRRLGAKVDCGEALTGMCGPVERPQRRPGEEGVGPEVAPREMGKEERRPTGGGGGQHWRRCAGKGVAERKG
jgi:hypothetical protein